LLAAKKMERFKIEIVKILVHAVLFNRENRTAQLQQFVKLSKLQSIETL